MPATPPHQQEHTNHASGSLGHHIPSAVPPIPSTSSILPSSQQPSQQPSIFEGQSYQFLPSNVTALMARTPSIPSPPRRHGCLPPAFVVAPTPVSFNYPLLFHFSNLNLTYNLQIIQPPVPASMFSGNTPSLLAPTPILPGPAPIPSGSNPPAQVPFLFSTFSVNPGPPPTSAPPASSSRSSAPAAPAASAAAASILAPAPIYPPPPPLSDAPSPSPSPSPPPSAPASPPPYPYPQPYPENVQPVSFPFLSK